MQSRSGGMTQSVSVTPTHSHASAHTPVTDGNATNGNRSGREVRIPGRT